jgi:hypothetical protein
MHVVLRTLVLGYHRYTRKASLSSWYIGMLRSKRKELSDDRKLFFCRDVNYVCWLVLW